MNKALRSWLLATPVHSTRGFWGREYRRLVRVLRCGASKSEWEETQAWAQQHRDLLAKTYL